MRYRPVFKQLQLQSQQSAVDSRDAISHWLDADTSRNSPSASRPEVEVAQPPTSPSPSASPPRPQLQSRVRRRKPLQPLQQSHGNQLTAVQPSRKRKMADRDDEEEESERASRGGRELRDRNALQKTEKCRFNEEQGLHGQQIHNQYEYTQQGRPQRRQSPVKATASGPPSTPRGLDQVASATPVFDAGRGALPKVQQSPSKGSSNPSNQSAVSQRAQMARLEKPIQFVTSKQRFESNKDKAPAANLWFVYIRSGSQEKVVPSSLKENTEALITPTKLLRPVPKENYIPPQVKSNFREADYGMLWVYMKDVLLSADKYRNKNYHEPHWVMRVVHPLLGIVRQMSKYKNGETELLEVPDMSVVSMQATLVPRGVALKDLNKKIDGAMGLSLSLTDTDVLERATYNGPHPSINAAAGEFVNFVPFYLFVEIKRPNQDKDPLIQLGAWVSAEFEKRSIEGYSLSTPVLAIEIDGDHWKLWVVEAKTDKEGYYDACRFVGPLNIGSTDDVVSAFQILHYLCLAADWALVEYRKYVEEQILAKYQ